MVQNQIDDKIIALKSTLASDRETAMKILDDLHAYLDEAVGNPAVLHTLRESLYNIKKYIDIFDGDFDAVMDARSDYDAITTAIPLIAEFLSQTNNDAVSLCNDLQQICNNINDSPHKYLFIMSLLDSEPKYFKGDLIITDPCYFITDIEGWEKSQHGLCLDQVGFHKFMARSIIYENWICTAYNSDTNAILGDFSSDSRCLCVTTLDEFNTYRFPGSKLFENGLAFLVKNFEGCISFKIDEIEFEHNGMICYDYALHVVGRGIDFTTNEPINFITDQTGF